MITLEKLCSAHGDKKVFIQDVDPGERAKLAQTVDELTRAGHAIFLMDAGGKTARPIRSYDPERNEWLVSGTSVEAPSAEGEAKPRRKGKIRGTIERVAAAATRATAFGQVAGG